MNFMLEQPIERSDNFNEAMKITRCSCRCCSLYHRWFLLSPAPLRHKFAHLHPSTASTHNKSARNNKNLILVEKAKKKKKN